MSKGTPPPLRFLALVVGGWIAIRAAAWIGWPDVMPPDALPDAMASPASAPSTPFVPPPGLILDLAPKQGSAQRYAQADFTLPSSTAYLAVTAPLTMTTPPDARLASSPPPHVGLSAGPGGAGISSPPSSRWSGSAWLLARRDRGTPPLAPGGILGGSQAGGRILYRLNDDAARPLALSVRVYAPLRGRGAEAALGLDWRPIEQIPVHLLVERRQAIDGGGRSAFAASIHGGASFGIPAGGRLDVYVQAGAVGLSSRDLFADGAMRVGVPLGPVELGGGVWGAGQPGTTRLDAGPQVTLPFSLSRANLRLSADWRFRLAGDAMPGSGPALTIGADF
jgi:hypothetical protein